MPDLKDSAEILVAVRDVLATNAEIIAFCANLYSKRAKVYLDINSRRLPRKDDYPIIVIFDVEKDAKGESSNNITFVVDIGVAILQEAVDIDETTNTETQRGKIEVEQFRRLIEKVIYDARLATITDTDGQTLKDDIYPLFRTDTTIKLTFKRSSRRPFK